MLLGEIILVILLMISAAFWLEKKKNLYPFDSCRAILIIHNLRIDSFYEQVAASKYQPGEPTMSITGVSAMPNRCVFVVKT